MANSTEIIMTTKDCLEIGYWVVSLLILSATVFYIYYSPIKAVKIGRELNDEQNKYKTKSDLFLTLFSLRGNPTHYSFVNGLNQIDIVFQDEPTVLAAWGKLYESLNQNNQVDPISEWGLLRTELLSEMATSLGYKKLKQTDIQKNYSPQAHENKNIENWNYQQAAKTFFETGTEMHKLWIESASGSQQSKIEK